MLISGQSDPEGQTWVNLEWKCYIFFSENYFLKCCLHKYQPLSPGLTEFIDVFNEFIALLIFYFMHMQLIWQSYFTKDTVS